jgi:hypothetical protein
MRNFILLCPAVALLGIAFTSIAHAEDAFPAHRVIGNTYYVGSKALACYLIETA